MTQRSLTPFTRLGLLGLTVSASTLAACGDPCLDDGRGKVGAVCEQSTAANESSTGTDSNETGTGTVTDTNETGTASASATMTMTDTDTNTDTDTGTDTGGDEFWCEDEDGDGFGDPGSCVPVPPGEDPPSGSVPMDQATDCDDADPNTFPGAAELDDPLACMTDADDDGFGDDMPSNPNAVPGTDCNDDNINAFPGAAELDDPNACMEDDDDDGYGDLMPMGGSTIPGTDCDDADMLILACEIWCPDIDMDGFGDGTMCVPVIPGDMPPPGHVMDGSDCNDADANTFVGAAELDDPNACMTDSDNDGWGEGSPGPGVMPGRDCDDTDTSRVVCVDVTPSCADTNLGMGTQLDAMATGGDGNYTWLWDNAMTLSDATIPNPIANPTEITTYTATATDGSGNAGTDSITVHLLDRPWVLGGPNAECMAFGFLGNPAPHSFANMDTTTCTTGNSDPTAYVCPTVHENARITGTMIVNPPADDDDFIGFVWGWQNPDQYYMLHWKQGAQNIGGCNSAAGITVKLFDRQQAYIAGDFTCNTSTANQTVLLTPAQTTTAGWVHGATYEVELLYANDQTEITITNINTNQVVTNFVLMDSTYPSGQFGTYDYSQIRACNGPWNSSCLSPDPPDISTSHAGDDHAHSLSRIRNSRRARATHPRARRSARGGRRRRCLARRRGIGRGRPRRGRCRRRHQRGRGRGRQRGRQRGRGRQHRRQHRRQGHRSRRSEVDQALGARADDG
jgi:hypothetical protein